ncbi:MAG: Ni/Fe hydrogenase, partial [Deltaproteobacteria bacterium]|nr:Ni/Fe hydrogenase [Deltaproteobacteria bacterium]
GAGITIGLIHRWQAGRLVLRSAGSMVSGAGIYFLVRALT